MILLGSLLVGCMPPGPKALLEGRRLLDQGKPEAAIPRLLQATELLPTNALAWGSLGVAYHQAGRSEQAFKAYQTALKLDDTMGTLRFNLGCLYLEMNNVGAAIDELRAFTLIQPNSPEGWLKLGTAQYRVRRLEDAEKSFASALSIQSNSAEALNGLGLIQVQRRRWPDAIKQFNAAQAADTNFAPALLNAAVVHQQYLNNRPRALDHYRRYLTLIPDAPAEVRAAAAQLERELSPAPAAVTAPGTLAAHTVSRTNSTVDRPPPDARARPSTGVATLAATPAPSGASATQSPGAGVRNGKPLELVPVTTARPTNHVRVAESSKTAPAVPAPVPPPVVPVTPAVASNPPAANASTAPAAKPALEVAKVRDEMVVRPAQDLAPATKPPAAIVPSASGSSTNAAAMSAATVPARTAESTPPPAKRGFFSRLNPFSRSGRDTNATEAASPVGDASSAGRELARPAGLPELAPAIARYAYASPQRPPDGNRTAAVTDFRRAVKAQKSGDRVRAVADYQAALRVDPGFFDAYYNLGLVALDSGDARMSLWAYELALALQPDSADARYNLSLALKAGGYPLDAADQLQILLQRDADDARAHLSLANLYAQQLKQPRRARDHYLRVLDLNPKHPEAATIRYWLAANP